MKKPNGKQALQNLQKNNSSERPQLTPNNLLPAAVGVSAPPPQRFIEPRQYSVLNDGVSAATTVMVEVEPDNDDVRLTPEGWLQQYQAWNTPMDQDECIHLLGYLDSMYPMAANQTVKTRAAVYERFSRELMRFPKSIVEQAIDSWPAGNDWFPKLSELVRICEVYLRPYAVMARQAEQLVSGEAISVDEYNKKLSAYRAAREKIEAKTSRKGKQ